MSTFHLDIRRLLRFYDDEVDARSHSNAVKTVAGEELGLALFQHYLTARQGDPMRLPGACTGKGAWLDGWIRVSRPRPMLYQVEVKSWSMHGYAGRKQQLAVDAAPSVLSAYKVRLWDHYWKEGDFTAPGLRKVLLEMTRPSGHDMPIEPVACIWTAVHPAGLADEFFTVSTKRGPFTSVNVFSMSAYLRNLAAQGTETIELVLPATAQRINYLQDIFRPPLRA